MHIDVQFAHRQIIESAGLALTLLAVTTGFHYEALRLLLHRLYGRHISLRWVVRLLVALVAIHGAEIALYAGAYAFGADVLGVGRLRGAAADGWVDFCYFAAETYSTLGYGDLVPIGALRFVASIEAVNGVLLLAASGAFLSGVLHEGFREEVCGRSRYGGGDSTRTSGGLLDAVSGRRCTPTAIGSLAGKVSSSASSKRSSR